MSRRTVHVLSMNLTGALLVAVTGGCSGLSRVAATAALEPLPPAGTPLWGVHPETITLNDCRDIL